jgi:N-acetylglucosaminyldiphosphoundecaprenol N-acetyl-beta-D-mannosaminyltransferase
MKKQLISISISTGSYLSFVDRLIQMSETSGSTYTCVANVHMLVEAHKDPAFASVVNNADLITPDGLPLTWGLKLLYGLKQDRVAGMDLLPDLLKRSEQKSIPVYFYGGTEEMLSKTKEYSEKHYPSLKIAGMYSPPFRALSVEEEQSIIKKINVSGAKFVFVALGCPKQEKWMASMKGLVNACMIGIGGALPVLVGMQKRAPLWMQKYGLEWLYRLLQEPKRLFKRYAVTNTLFLWLLFKVVVKNFFKGGK